MTGRLANQAVSARMQNYSRGHIDRAELGKSKQPRGDSGATLAEVLAQADPETDATDRRWLSAGRRLQKVPGPFRSRR